MSSNRSPQISRLAEHAPRGTRAVYLAWLLGVGSAPKKDRVLTYGIGACSKHFRPAFPIMVNLMASVLGIDCQRHRYGWPNLLARSGSSGVL
jgi:hypothetical protein